METMNRSMRSSKTIRLFYALFQDRLFIALILAFTALMLLDSARAWQSLAFSIHSMFTTAPFFILAMAFAGFAKASGIDTRLSGIFSVHSRASIVAAALAGALSPFCSCGVIPVIGSMLASGVPLAPVMAFWISSPIMDPEMFIITTAGLGLNFAVAKTVAAMGMGLFAGFAVVLLQKAGFFLQPVKKGWDAEGSSSADPKKTGDKVVYRFWRVQARLRNFVETIRYMGVFLGKWMFFAFFLESLMVAYVPAEWIGGIVGGHSALAIPFAAIIGIPAYMNGYAAVPLVSGLVEMGMAPGPAMAFITSGAVSSIPAAMAVYALVKKPVFTAYILFGLLGSVGAGAIYQLAMACL